jgi:hypothetical protein
MLRDFLAFSLTSQSMVSLQHTLPPSDSATNCLLAKVILSKDSNRSPVYNCDTLTRLTLKVIVLCCTLRQHILLKIVVDTLLVFIAAALLVLVIAVSEVMADT